MWRSGICHELNMYRVEFVEVIKVKVELSEWNMLS
jgi:hypothetical protein